MAIDIQKLKDYLHGDNAFMASMIETFISEANSIIETMKKASAAEDWPTVKANAHKMLSSVKIFEMTNLVQLLERIEKNAKETTNIPEIKEDVKNVVSLTKQTLVEMQIELDKLKKLN